MSIDLICPSRGRPDAALELQKSFDATKRLDHTRLIFALDTDDPTTKDYPGVCNLGAPTGDPTGPLNRVSLSSGASIVGFIGDDSRLATKGWDELVEEALREPGFCWGDDKTGPAAWPSTAFASKVLVERMGYFALPTLRRGFFDIQWITVARGAGIERIIKAEFPHDNHEHPVAKEIIDADQAAYMEWHKAGGRHEIDIAICRLAHDLEHFFPQELVNV